MGTVPPHTQVRPVRAPASKRHRDSVSSSLSRLCFGGSHTGGVFSLETPNGIHVLRKRVVWHEIDDRFYVSGNVGDELLSGPLQTGQVDLRTSGIELDDLERVLFGSWSLSP